MLFELNGKYIDFPLVLWHVLIFQPDPKPIGNAPSLRNVKNSFVVEQTLWVFLRREAFSMGFGLT